MRRSILGLLILVLMASVHAQEETIFSIAANDIISETSNFENICDLDCDGLYDLLILHAAQIYRYEQSFTGSISFCSLSEDYLGNIIAIENSLDGFGITDLDNNGLYDIITKEFDPSLGSHIYFRYEQTASASLDFELISEVPYFAYGRYYADIDNDNLLDLVKSYHSFDGGSIFHYEQALPNSEEFTLVTRYFMDFELEYGWYSEPVFGNIDHDDQIDLAIRITQDCNWQWYEFNPEFLTFEYVMELTFDVIPAGAVGLLFDYDLDGYDDFMALGTSMINIYHNNVPEMLDYNEEVIPELLNTIQNAYPNPFNPETTISLDIAQGEHADLTIYNTRGQKVRDWEKLSSGEHHITWNGRDSKGTPVSSGIYMVVLRTDNHTSTKKVSLIK